jgi:hypothetical protein
MLPLNPELAVQVVASLYDAFHLPRELRWVALVWAALLVPVAKTLVSLFLGSVALGGGYHVLTGKRLLVELRRWWLVE